MSSFKKSRLSRLSQMGLTVIKAGSEYAKHKVTEKWQANPASEYYAQVKAAQEIIKTMGELKGAMMKLGQILSITEDMILPPEVSQLFKQLQKDAPPMSDSDIDKVFLQSFHKKPEELFKVFERKAFACASIGQVHKAILPDGKAVAVKVQYPDIKQAVLHDFKNLDMLDDLLGKIFKQKPNIDTTIAELKETLALECDYLHEAKKTRFFKEALKQRFPQILVPEVYQEFSTDCILTLELMQGESFDKTLSYTQEQRDFLGQTIYDLFLFSLYEHHELHTDPQNGNYLFRPDAVVLLDFGSTRAFPAEFILTYTQLLDGLERKSYQDYSQAIIELGFFTLQDEEKGLIRKHYEMMDSLYSPYARPGKRSIEKINPFEQAKSFIQQIDLKGRIAPRREFFHLDRCHLGLYTKIKSWDARLDWVTSRNAAREIFRQQLSLLNSKN